MSIHFQSLELFNDYRMSIYAIRLFSDKKITCLPPIIQKVLSEGGIMKLHKKCIDVKLCKSVEYAYKIANKKIDQRKQCISMIIEMFSEELMGRTSCLQTQLNKTFFFVLIVDKLSIEIQTEALLKLFIRPAHRTMLSLNRQLIEPYNPETYQEYRQVCPSTVYCVTDQVSFAGTAIIGSKEKLSEMSYHINNMAVAENVVFPIAIKYLLGTKKHLGYILTHLISKIKNTLKRKTKSRVQKCTDNWNTVCRDDNDNPSNQHIIDWKMLHILVGITTWTITPVQREGIVMNHEEKIVEIDIDKIIPTYQGKVGLIDNPGGKVETIIELLQDSYIETPYETATRETFEEFAIFIDSSVRDTSIESMIPIAEGLGQIFCINVDDTEIIFDEENKLVCLRR